MTPAPSPNLPRRLALLRHVLADPAWPDWDARQLALGLVAELIRRQQEPGPKPAEAPAIITT